jgi:hypothetical protein
MVGIWFLWVVFLDSPHLFGTFSRTYLDKQEFRQRRKLLTLSLLWFLAGPAVILLGYGLFELGVGAYQLPWKLLLIFLGLWAYWHVVRQHYGFMRLYQKKNADSHPIDARLDSALLYAGLLLPFLVYINRHPETRYRWAFRRPPGLPAVAGRRSLDGAVHLSYLTALSWEHWIVAISAAHRRSRSRSWCGRPCGSGTGKKSTGRRSSSCWRWCRCTCTCASPRPC